MNRIVQASLETRHFTFEAYGDSRAKALKALSRGLERHAVEYRIPLDWWHEMEEDIMVRDIDLEVAYRDREPLRTH